jgi:hypothetical protein
MPIIEINLADADRGSDSHQVRTGDEPAFGYRAKIVDLELHCGEAARAVEVVMDGAADGGVGDTRRDTAVQRPGGIQQLRAQAALDGEAVAMHANDLKAKQVVECVFGEERSNQVGRLLRVVQVGDSSIVERE